MTQTIALPETSLPSILVPATLFAASEVNKLAETYAAPENKKATVDRIIAESVKKTNRGKAAAKAPTRLMANKPKSRNKGQVPWNKGLKLATGGKRMGVPKNKSIPRKKVVKSGAGQSLSRAKTPSFEGIFGCLDAQEPAEVRQFKSTFKKGSKYDEGFEAGYQEAVHDMTMILVSQVGRKQL